MLPIFWVSLSKYAWPHEALLYTHAHVTSAVMLVDTIHGYTSMPQHWLKQSREPLATTP